MIRIVRVALSVALLAGIGACSVISPTDAVRDEQAAIEIAKAELGPAYGKQEFWKDSGGSVGWHARLIRDTWVVWFGPNYSDVTLDTCLGPSCYIAKRDGSKQCVICAA